MKRIFQLIDKNLSKFNISFGKKASDKKNLPIITVSREKGSGGRLIAFLVKKKLGKNWQVYHKEIIEEIAKKTHLEKKMLDELDEKQVPLVDIFIGEIFGRRYPAFSSYYKNLIRVISTIGQIGNVIVIGRGSEYIIPSALKVRIICEMEQRIKWIMEYERVLRKRAMEMIEKSDFERTEFVRSIYQHDTRKAHHYDLVIRTGPNLSIDDAADLIVCAAKRRFKI